MFEKLKTIFKTKEAPAEKPAQSRNGSNGDSVLSKVTSVGREKSSRAPVPLAPTEGEAKKSAPAAPESPTPAPAPAQPQALQPKAPAQPVGPSPEEICGVTAKMSKDEVRTRLAFLYKRYNRATSSLNAKLRAEANDVLDAVVAVREKVFGPI
ncbi:hypothetical protein DES53_106204 [Roseimicrobium gellanilyticum]|uniref:Uncharacterized protein n=1 Tax=Roseimicrobium gellanilyticum TaxID=748857 RepID=A0A366HJE9_9BACT|nr:hypothetical protein [Roseimicrobium gellanilyticum]RBP42495.1 hypothetical protein DES53_106204 [Roseimicrobium gellanilyticum]